MAKRLIVLGMPCRGNQVSFGAAQGFNLWASATNDILRTFTASSLLDHTFNRLWCCALNLKNDMNATHFAMLHDDICPQQHWLDKLAAELDDCGADILSVVVPIKSPQGLTSTAVETDDPWMPRRLTLHECHELPMTFGDEEADGEILLNTGCWICRYGPWAYEPWPITFQNQNRIVMDDDGRWQAQVQPEDWQFSRAARERGAILKATRIISVVHNGEQEFPNDRPWGDWKTDKLHEERMAKQTEIAKCA